MYTYLQTYLNRLLRLRSRVHGRVRGGVRTRAEEHVVLDERAGTYTQKKTQS